MSELIKIDRTYKNWISDVSKRFQQSQLKAAANVNEEMLRFYWTLGKDISQMGRESKYGSKFYTTISTDLKDVLPGVKSFSPTNLKYMRYFYEMYPSAGICQQTVDEFELSQNRQQPVDDSSLQIIFRIPWGHHVLLLNKCDGNQEKALFYVKKTIENNWSRARKSS